MKGKLSLLILGIGVVLLVVGAVGCSTQQQTSSGNGGGKSYFPCIEGYSWRYINNRGEITLTTVEGTVTIGSNVAYRFYSTYISTTDGTSTGESYFKIDDSGVYICSKSYPELVINYLLFPLEVGKNWRAADIPTAAVFEIAAKETVTIPLGSFECYKVIITYYDDSKTSVWYADNVGMIKSFGTYTSSGNFITSESYLDWKNF